MPCTRREHELASRPRVRAAGLRRVRRPAAFADADTLRGLTTDRATYDYVLDLLEADEGPQFVFDVTLQNHGGYDVGGLSDELAVSVPLGDGSRRRSWTSTPASYARRIATSPTSWIG